MTGVTDNPTGLDTVPKPKFSTGQKIGGLIALIVGLSAGSFFLGKGCSKETSDKAVLKEAEFKGYKGARFSTEGENYLVVVDQNDQLKLLETDDKYAVSKFEFEYTAADGSSSGKEKGLKVRGKAYELRPTLDTVEIRVQKE